MKCSICKEEIKPDLNGWNKGHNAEPINNGKCCGFCNDTIVSVTRLTIFAHRHESK
jgi:hypothetical protein|tara:strand:- start:200 stop:367 length:168 start_codon:yes stop_codon:yes gene_type:complete